MQTNIDDVRARIMELESAPVFDQRAWAQVLIALAGSPCRRADAARRMGTARSWQEMLPAPAPAAAVVFMGEQPGGRKRWSVNGQEVITWSDYSHCLRCGRPLTNSMSRARGYGDECHSLKNEGTKIAFFVSAETAEL